MRLGAKLGQKGARTERWAAHHNTHDPARIPDRFWAKVDRTTSCWLWTATKTTKGYGHFFPRHGRTALAHRFSYELVNGPIPAGLVIDHLCRTPSCVRPDHLEAVTQAQNLQRGPGSKPTCRQGHEFDAANTHVDAAGHRRCRACDRARHAGAYRAAPIACPRCGMARMTGPRGIGRLCRSCAATMRESA